MVEGTQILTSMFLLVPKSRTAWCSWDTYAFCSSNWAPSAQIAAHPPQQSRPKPRAHSVPREDTEPHVQIGDKGREWVGCPRMIIQTQLREK